MKVVFLLLLILSSSVSLFAQYKYMDKEISDAQFAKLFASFGKYVFTFDKDTYDFSGTEPDKLKPFKGVDADFGVVTIKVNSSNKDKKEISGDRIDDTVSRRIDQAGKRCVIINAECENLKSKAELPVLKLDKDKYKHPGLTSSSILLTQVKPASREQFGEYLNKGGLCYEYKRLTPEFVTCDVCKGSGRVFNNMRAPNSTAQEYITCTKCNGTGKVKPTVIQYAKDKILLTP